MHQIIFYPVGNGDSSQIILDNGKRILFDYRHLKKAEGVKSPEIDLKTRLKEELEDAKRDYIDVVAFTHSDSDHIENSTEFFELRYAQKYQGNGRIKISELWVPAAMILETAANGEQGNEFVIWRQEAQYRLKKGEGIRVFSKPDKLKSWLEGEGLTVDSRKHLITDAGSIVPGFDLKNDGIEFFCHSPFIRHADEGDDLRNPCSLIFNVRLKAGGNTYDYLAVGDSEWEILEEIVSTTRYHKNDDRLAWDIFNIPHHCSYKALSDDKGEKETEPKPLIKDLLLQGKTDAYIVSSNNPIRDSKEAREQTQPPHIQAKKCYERYLKEIDGAKFLVTMEEPNEKVPEPLVFNIDINGIKRSEKKVVAAPSVIITSNPAPRAG